MNRIGALVVLALLGLTLAASAQAAVPRLTGTVGPSFTITLKQKTVKAGKVTLVVADRSSIHNFHLRGKGVNVRTSITGTGTKRFTLTLQKGVYTFVCDPHAGSMHGTLRVS